MNCQMTFCAVIVTYNRKLLLSQCLESLTKQSRVLDAIFLIDNASSDGTSEMLTEKGYMKDFPVEINSDYFEKESMIESSFNQGETKLYYIRMKENTGGAGGFHEGVKRAYEMGYDWLWLMDDDTVPEEDALEKLCEHCTEENVYALACVVKDDDGEIQLLHRGYFNFKNVFPLIQEPLSVDAYSKQDLIEIDFASFVGVLIHGSAIKGVGFPKKEFFSQHDDLEYFMRLKKVGKVLLITNSIVIHKEQTESSRINKNFLWRKSPRIPYNRLWVLFYFHRNLIWLGKTNTLRRWRFYFGLLKSYIRYSVGILLLDDYKYRRIKLITCAYFDGLTSRFDNSRVGKILYGKPGFDTKR